jgi:hypothetical protein
MKKSRQQLAKLASKFQRKYAQSQSLQEIIQNAANWGEQSANGIMNFPAQLKKDNAELSINVAISGNDVNVSPATVSPVQFSDNYAKLPAQIQNYLSKHVRDFPLPQGTTTLEYGQRSAGEGIAVDQ